MNKKMAATLILLLIMILGFAGSKYVDDMNVKREALRQEEEKKRNEEEIKQRKEEEKKRKEARRNALVEAGIKAIVHTKVLEVAKDAITVQEIYPFIDKLGKTYPVLTFTLVPMSETTYAKRVYEANLEGLITTNFKDEEGSFEEIKPEMFVSAMVLDDLDTSEKTRARTIVYFDRFPGIRYATDETVKDENKSPPIQLKSQ